MCNKPTRVCGIVIMGQILTSFGGGPISVEAQARGPAAGCVTDNKKLSYCCGSRSYCVQKYDRLKQLLRDTLSILTPSLLCIHCDRSFSTCE